MPDLTQPTAEDDTQGAKMKKNPLVEDETAAEDDTQGQRMRKG